MVGYDYKSLKNYIGKKIFVRLQFGRNYYGVLKSVSKGLILTIEFYDGLGSVSFPAYEIRELKEERK